MKEGLANTHPSKSLMSNFSSSHDFYVPNTYGSKISRDGSHSYRTPCWPHMIFSLMIAVVSIRNL